MMTTLEGEILGPETGSGAKSGGKSGGREENSVRKNFWRTFARAADHIPFAEDLVAAYYCALDPKTPTRVKGTLLAALAYFVFPLDTIPDILALVGFSDDIAVLTIALATVRSHMTEAHSRAARNALDRLKSGKAPEART